VWRGRECWYISTKGITSHSTRLQVTVCEMKLWIDIQYINNNCTIYLIYFYVLLTVHTCIMFQMKPTECTLLLGLFISTSVHVSGNYVPIIRRTYCIYATVLWVAVWSTDQAATHTEWKITLSHRYSKFSWWWAHSCLKHVEKLKQISKEVVCT